MADIFSKEKRSEIMSRIRGKNTKVEKDFLKILSKEIYPLGYRYRKHYKKIPGSPDIVFPRYKVAIFIDGDFWHGWKYEDRKKKLSEFWRKKIERNMERDLQNMKDLDKIGWRVLRIWEHEAKKDSDKVLRKVLRLLSYDLENSKKLRK